MITIHNANQIDAVRATKASLESLTLDMAQISAEIRKLSRHIMSHCDNTRPQADCEYCRQQQCSSQAHQGGETSA